MEPDSPTARFYKEFVELWDNLIVDIDTGCDYGELKSGNAPWRNASLTRQTEKKPKYTIPLKQVLRWDGSSDLHLSLGEAIRCKLVHNLCGIKSNQEFKTALQEHGRCGSSTINQFLSPYSKIGTNKELTPVLKETICCTLNALWRVPRNLNPLKVSDLFNTPFTGPTAIKDFEDFLSTDESYAQPFLPNLRYFSSSVHRSNNMEEIHKQTFGQSSGPRVINIQANGMRRGLTALGVAITKSFASDPRTQFSELRWLYLPVNNYLDHPNTRAFHDAPGFNVLLGRLRHFYCDKLDDISKAKPIAPTADYRRIIQDIREGMIARPRILILDGVQVYSNDDRVSSIERMIAGDNALDLVLALLDPALCSVTSQDDLSELAKNRIILLSNDKPDPKVFENKLHPTVDLVPLEFQEPDEDEANQIIAASKFKNLTLIQQFRISNPQMIKSWSDSHYYALDTLFSANLFGKRDTLIELQNSLDRVSTSFNRPAGQPADLFALVSLSLEIIPEQYNLLKKLMYLISAAPDGLRISTLQRLAHASIQAGDNHGLITNADIESFGQNGSPQSLEQPSNVVRTAIALLISTFPSFFRQSPDDFFYGVDSAPHPLEFGISPSPTTQTVEKDVLTIQYYFPEFRLLVRDSLAGNAPNDTFYLCHRLLAEDALSQQTVGLRHGEFSEQQSIHHWRRQFAAFYHGLCSLPLIFDRNAGVRIAKGRLSKKIELDTITPKQPRAFWPWLYLFAYRRMIEQPPNYAMSRILGEEVLKRDLLEAFNRPWKLWPPTFMRSLPRGGEDANLFVGEYLSKPSDVGQFKKGLSITRAYYFSLFQSHYILGELTKMRQVLNQLSSDQLAPTPDLNSDISLLKRRLDLSVLELERPNSIEKHVRGSWDVLERAYCATEPLTDSEDKDDMASYLNTAVSRGGLINIELVLNPAGEHQDLFKGKKEAAYIAKRLVESLQDVDGITSVADILFRIAELHAVHADQSEDADRLPERSLSDDGATALKKLQHTKFTLLSIPSKYANDPNMVILALCHAHALFTIAEEMRLLAFEMNPLSNKYLASGHSTRTMVRIGLKLENQRRRMVAASGLRNKGSGPFGKRARRDSDTLSRHLFRFPRDRAAQLILEVSKLRLLSEPGDRYLDSLCAARRLLARVEPIVMRSPGNSRQRLRLSLERSKIHRAIAQRQPDDEEAQLKRDMMLSLCDTDLTFMEKHPTKDRSCKIWFNIAKQQRRIYKLTRKS